MSGISRGKVKKMKNFRDVFKKVCPHIMPNILHWNQFMEKKPVVGMTSYFSPIYGTVFELAQGLQDSRTSDFKCSYGALVQKEAFTICQDRLFTSFFCDTGSLGRNTNVKVNIFLFSHILNIFAVNTLLKTGKNPQSYSSFINCF